MTTTLAGFGLQPIRHISAESARQVAIAGGITSGTTADIFSYQAVKLSSNGVIQPAAAGDALYGIFVGCEYTTPDGVRVQSPVYVSGTTYATGSMTAYVQNDPNVIYAIQADGSVAQTAVGGQANLTNATSGSTTIGFSQQTLNSSVTAAGTAQFRILSLYTVPGNDWGDTYTIVEVQISAHQYVANINSI